MGINFRRPQPRPATSHPLEDLTFVDGAIRLCRKGQAPVEYLMISGLQVLAKKSLLELQDGRCEYRFELNGITDSTWRTFFAKLLPAGLSVRFEPRILVLTCPPAELESRYNQVKSALWGANDWYAEEREDLIRKVTELDDARQAAAEMEENRKAGLRRQFECLDL
ncbi:MAG: hypothetical protein U1F98_03240 [Verrucomicrobiota bacterium]